MNNQFSYTQVGNRVSVRLDGRKVGEIRPAKGGGFVYQPLGSKMTGDKFSSVALVKASIEAA